MTAIIRVTSLVFAASVGLALAGCANDGSGMFGFNSTTTASIPEKPKIDPVCVTLTSQIDGLKKEGIAEKVEKAAIKKYKMTPADLNKAAQLNRANAEFQNKCSSMTTAQLSPAAGVSEAPSGAKAVTHSTMSSSPSPSGGE